MTLSVQVHFGVKQQLTTKITEMNAPYSFADEMLKGVFRSIRHEHLFEEKEGGITEMIDLFHFESPFGLLGQLFNAVVLTNYMTRFLEERNAAIKEHLS